MFNCLSLSPPLGYEKLSKRNISFSVNLILVGVHRRIQNPVKCLMELVAEVANCFLFLQNASSYMFGRVLNAPLNWRKVFKNLLGWSHWLGICRSKECHKSFKLINISNVYHTEESLELQEVNIVDIQDRQRPLHVLYIIPRSRDLLLASLLIQVV